MRFIGTSLSMALGLVVCMTTAQAQSGHSPRVLECYKRVTVPAQYSTKKVLIRKAQQKYLQKGDILQLVEYPAIYREDKTLVKPEHQLLQKISCSEVPPHLLPIGSTEN